MSILTFFFKRDGTNDLQVDEHKTGQGIGGVAFRFSDFGIANGTKIYGYSLMANDFSGTTGSNVVDYTNTTYFPTNSGETVGGLDPLAVMGVSMETVILPVKMTSFSATAAGNKSDLKWSTATEINNNGFDVERSADGVNWKRIGFVPSKATGGNSNSQLEYNYQDVQPLAGNNYYRLTQTDLNNKITSSEIRTVSFKIDRGALAIFPNPVKDVINIGGVEKGYSLQLMDNKGAIISHSTSEGSVALLQTSNLTPGIYFVRVSDKQTIIKTMKVVKI
ncbi:MAG: T9SS type A sorting domain-containing protein [Chitinophagaceae bacterium]